MPPVFSAEAAALVHCVAVVALTSLIWLVQLAVYPALVDIEPSHWPAFHRRHTRSATCLMLPLMVVQVGSATILFSYEKSHLHGMLLILACVHWAVTAVVIVPLLQSLYNRPVLRLIRRLCALNWLRVFLLTASAIASVSSLLH